MVDNSYFVPSNNYDLDIISEESFNSNKVQSYLHLDLLGFNFIQDILHDGNLLHKALAIFMKIDVHTMPDIWLMHFNQIKTKLDQFFDQKLVFKTDQEIELISDLCQKINEFQQVILNAQHKIKSHQSEESIQEIMDASRRELKNLSEELNSFKKRKNRHQSTYLMLNKPIEIVQEDNSPVFLKPKSRKLKKSKTTDIDPEFQPPYISANCNQNGSTTGDNNSPHSASKAQQQLILQSLQEFKDVKVDDIIVNINNVREQQQQNNQQKKQMKNKNQDISYKSNSFQNITNSDEEEKKQIIQHDSFEQSFFEMQELLKKMIYFYQEKILDQSEKCRVQIMKIYSQIQNQTKHHLYPQLNNFITSNVDQLNFSEEQYKDLQKGLEWLDVKDGWIQEKEQNNIKVSYRFIQGSPLLILQIITSMEVNIKKLISLVYEAELYTHWFPFCQHARKVKQLDKATQLFYIHQSPPIITDREMYLLGVGIDRMEENGTIVIQCKTVDQNLKFQNQFKIDIPVQSQYVRVDVHFASFEVKPKNENFSDLRIVASFDGKLQFLPNMFVNLIIRKFAFYLFEKLLRNTRNFESSPWAQKIKENQEFYSWIDEKVKKYFSQQKK